MPPADRQLAIDGGSPVIPGGPPGWPLEDRAVRAALAAAYKDGSWGRYEGPQLERLAQRLKALQGADHVTLCASGTIAVEMALRGLGVGAGDEVILAGYDYPGNFRSIEAIGARPVLVDIDPRTWCLDADRVEAASSSRTRAVVVSHLHGGIASMRKLTEIAASLGIGVVEDACQMPGAEVEGRAAGSWGDAGVLSFGGSKLLTAGRGGAVVTSRADVHQRMKIYAHRGNHAFPLSTLQASVLLPQLDRLAERNRGRTAAVERLLARTADLAHLRPVVHRTAGRPGYYKLAWSLDPAIDRDWLVAAVRAEGVDLGAGFPGFVRRSSRRCRRAGKLEASHAAAQATVVLHHPVLLAPAETLDLVPQALEKVLHAAAGSAA